MVNVKNLIRELRKFSDDIISINKPIDESLIQEFEVRHKVELPLDYKDLLKSINGFSLMGSEVYGIGDTEHTQNLDKVYQFEHFEVKIPQFFHLVPFSDDGGGGFYCFDCSKKSDDGNSCPIVFWVSNYIYTEGDIPEVTNESFIDFVDECIIGWTLDEYDYNGNEK